MAGIKHLFQSQKADSADTTLVRPSNWNADHDLTDAPLGPNLVINSDFGRRTVFGLAMPEVFADTSGYIKIDAGAAPTVSANVLTFGAANNELAWANGSFVWRDGRMSATFKAVAIAGIYQVRWRIDANNYIRVIQNNGNITLSKVIGGANTDLSTVANVLTVNNWYWLEIEKQGTTIIVKIYNTGGTASGVTKASSTLLQTLTGAVSDAGVQTGAHISITSDQATAQWGGIATGNGGVYVETWLPESRDITFSGTLGGQAIGFDEAADSGPNVVGAPRKQWALRGYIPATNRVIRASQITPDGGFAASTAYAFSIYEKVSGLGGTGSLIQVNNEEHPSTVGSATQNTQLTDAGETTWTRKTATVTSHANTRRMRHDIYFNGNSTATGTAFVQLPQVEQGSAATAWRNAPADDDPLVWVFQKATDVAYATAVVADIDPRDLAGNLFFPWDCSVSMTFMGTWNNSGANANDFQFKIGAGAVGLFRQTLAAGVTTPLVGASSVKGITAGKSRIAVAWAPVAGTVTLLGASYAASYLTVTATRGK